MYLVASAVTGSKDVLNASDSTFMRSVRRFNLPVQLALRAGTHILPACEDASSAYIVSVAPCTAGSEELYTWGRKAVPSGGQQRYRDVRMNPTHTLHAVDNLALSAFSMTIKHAGEFLGLGGAPGQAWVGLESIYEHFLQARSREAILIAGDQAFETHGTVGNGVALLFSRDRRPYGTSGMSIQVRQLLRQPLTEHIDVSPDSSCGLKVFLISTVSVAERPGSFTYDVPPRDSDGCDRMFVSVELKTI